MMKKTLVLFMILLVSIPSFYQVYAIRPNYVYDWDDMLTDEQENVINDYCSKVDANTTAEIVVITLADGEGRTEEEARLYYYNDHPLDGMKGIGKADKDNGVLLVICLKDNFWGIEVGYGLEGDLTDSECGRIGRDILVKNLKEYKDYEAIYGTIKAISEEIGYGKTTNSQDTVIEENQTPDISEQYIFPLIVVAIIIIIILFVFLLSSDDDYSSDSLFGGGGGSSGGSSGGGGFGGGSSGGGGAGGGIRKLPIMDQPLEDLRLTISMATPFILQLFCPSCLTNMLCVSTKKPDIETREINEHRTGDYIESDEIKTHFIYGACLTCHTEIVKETELSRESNRRYSPEPHYTNYMSRSSSYGGSSFGGSSFGGGRSGGGGAGGRIR